MNYVETVGEFHKKMGILKGSPGATLLKRLRLMEEEKTELIIAMDQHDLIEIADACCDLVYVIAGTMEVMNIRQDSVYQFVLRDPENVGPLLLDENLQLRAIGLLNSANVEAYRALVYETGDFVRPYSALNHYIATVLRIAQMHNIPFDTCFEEVHRSNMTKSPLNEHGKGGKGPDFIPPDLKTILFAAGYGMKQS